MKQGSFRAFRSGDQRGVNIIDAVFAMVIASMIATAVTTSLGTWFNVRAMTASQDGANQYAQGVIAKASSVPWDKLGFSVPDATPSPANLMDDLSCLTEFRTKAKIGDDELKTVILEGEGATDLSQTAVAEVRGKKYCVITDITWNSPSDAGTKSAKSYGTKNISVKMSWQDRGTVRSITVNSTRSPNIGEAIPTGLSEGHDAETSPIKSFSITKAYHDGVDAKVCYVADWNDTGDVVSAVGSISPSFSPAATKTVLASGDRNNEKCFTNNNPSFALYGLVVGDGAGSKFISAADYQFPGSKLTVSGNTLSWNAYPASGTTKYKVYRSETAEFTEPAIATLTDTTYVLETGATAYVMVETINSDYAVTARSNTATVDPPAPTDGPKPYTAPAASDPCFTDAQGPYYTPICWAYARGITNGYANGTYGTDSLLKRDEMAAFLYRLDSSPAYTAPAVSPFSDVATTRIFYKQIVWAKDNSIVSGNVDGTYSPGGSVARDRMAVYLYRLAGSPAYTAPATSRFADVAPGRTYYKEISWMYDSGVFKGFPDGTYAPSLAIKRGETADFLYNWNQKFGNL
jgi:hypothetical protein